MSDKAKGASKRRGCLKFVVLVIIVALLWHYWPVHVDIAMDGPTAEWLDYGNDRGGTRYSPLTQITPDNVEHLEVAWIYHTADVSEWKMKTPTRTRRR